MDPRLLSYYNQELQHLHDMGAEFAQAFPKIAARLGVEGIEVSDPYVERLIEGAAFLASRVQLKIDAEFPRFTQRLLEIIYPNYLAPTPSMLIARFAPDMNEPNLARGVTIERGAGMRSLLGRGDRTACEFRTAHALTLWPIQLVEARYFSYAPDLPIPALPGGRRIRGGVRLRLRAEAGLSFSELDAQSLTFFLGGPDEVAHKLYELSVGASAGVLVTPMQRPLPWHEYLPPEAVGRVGYDDQQAVLPAGLRMFQGYRLLQEYFAFSSRFLFVVVDRLGAAFQRQRSNEIEVSILFERGDPALESVVDADCFQLYCTPAINLFEKRADRIHVDDSVASFHVVPDRTRPMDFEVFEVKSVTGYGAGNENEQAFRPFYAAYDEPDSASSAYFTVQREPRILSEKQQRNGARSSYIGTEVFLSLVDPKEAPYRADLRQLSIATLCTNRDLPLQMPLGAGETDFNLLDAAPITAVRCIKGPSRPYSPVWEGGGAWRLISHLALNYVSLVDTNPQEGAAALRELLTLYSANVDIGVRKQIEGVRAVRAERIVRRLPAAGRITFGRGLRLELDVDELAFLGAGAFLFGCVLEKFFSRYVSINSFTETVLRSPARGEIHRWVPRWGERLIL